MYVRYITQQTFDFGHLLNDIYIKMLKEYRVTMPMSVDEYHVAKIVRRGGGLQ